MREDVASGCASAEWSAAVGLGFYRFCLMTGICSYFKVPVQHFT